MSENYILNADPSVSGGLTNRCTLTCNGSIFSDWTAVSVTRSMESPTPYFEFLATNIDDEDAAALVPGAACTVDYGGARVLTGYVDGISRSIAQQNQIRVYGRGKCQDLVDSAFLYQDSGLLVADTQNTTIEKLARRLAAYYGIEVEVKFKADATNKEGNFFTANIPYVQASEGRTVYDILEPLSLWTACLLYESAEGKLVLASPAWGQHSGGDGETGAAVEVGYNVLAASSNFTVSNRFRNYYYTFAMTAYDLVNGRAFYDALQTVPIVDDGVPIGRTRSMVIADPLNQMQIKGASGNQIEFGKARAQWERNRRWGRSKVARIRVDSWVDPGGALWEPNWLCPFHAPEIGCSSVPEYTLGVKETSLASTILGTRTIARSGVVNWVIADVTYNLSMEGGTTADLTLMPTEAFLLEPSALYADPESVLAFGAGGNVPSN